MKERREGGIQGRGVKVRGGMEEMGIREEKVGIRECLIQLEVMIWVERGILLYYRYIRYKGT